MTDAVASGVLAVFLLAFAFIVVIGSEVRRWRQEGGNEAGYPEFNESVSLAPSGLKLLNQISQSVRTSPGRAISHFSPKRPKSANSSATCGVRTPVFLL